MSRIGKMPIELPQGVEYSSDKQNYTFKGALGEITLKIDKDFEITPGEQCLNIAPRNQTKQSMQYWGMYRTLIHNAIVGVSTGFTKTLEVNGVGFRAALQNGKLVLSLGFSHPIEYTPPEGIELKVEQNTIIVSGADKQKVGATAAAIREFRKPEPYKGKGIKYSTEVIRRKAGKTAAKTAG